MADTDRLPAYFSNLNRQSLAILKVPAKEIYMIATKKDGNGRWWIVSKQGIKSFNNHDDAMQSFFGMYKVSKSMNFVRKSSYLTLNQNKTKVAKLIKKSSSYYSKDEWIDDPENLVQIASREFWAMSKNGKYVARLFDEKQFPLEI